jgi:hypothetical protein
VDQFGIVAAAYERRTTLVETRYTNLSKIILTCLFSITHQLFKISPLF